MTRVAQIHDEALMRKLLRELGQEARDFRFEVAPNPCVGAAVLAGSRIVARGYHEVWGQDHAEVRALAAAQNAAEGEALDTLVVTLEPCSSTGKTAPCVDRILEAGIGTVVVGELDPDPRHRGRGLELLRSHGIEVVLLEGVAPLREVAPHFLAWLSVDRLRRPRPWVVAKWAQTLSGQLQPPENFGGGRWISGPEALAEVQILRGRVDAVLTGVGTVRADDPRLSVRPPGDTRRPPMRVVLDSWLSTRPEARLFAQPGADEAAGPVHLLCIRGADAARESALTAAGARVHGLRGSDRNHLDLRAVHAWLWEQGVRRVMIESGPHVLRSHLEARFIDQVKLVTGSVRGGQGESLGHEIGALDLLERRDRELGPDAVLEAFLEAE
jgi:diaminohydroxyphosphoribosylaminopyrimidine deaminase/5-amino-6-(5-phosphoribosylamino)uracil reductase